MSLAKMAKVAQPLASTFRITQPLQTAAAAPRPIFWGHEFALVRSCVKGIIPQFVSDAVASLAWHLSLAVGRLSHIPILFRGMCIFQKMKGGGRGGQKILQCVKHV